MGNFDKAEALFRKRQPINEKIYGRENSNCANNLNNLAGLYRI